MDEVAVSLYSDVTVADALVEGDDVELCEVDEVMVIFDIDVTEFVVVAVADPLKVRGAEKDEEALGERVLDTVGVRLKTPVKLDETVAEFEFVAVIYADKLNILLDDADTVLRDDSVGGVVSPITPTDKIDKSRRTRKYERKWVIISSFLLYINISIKWWLG